MRPIAAAAATVVVAALAGLAAYAGPLQLDAARAPSLTLAEVARAVRIPSRSTTIPVDSLTAVVRRVCTDCHSEGVLAGELSLEKFDVAKAAETPAIAEKMIAKLQAGMMPQPGAPRPGGDTLIQLATTLEQVLDKAASSRPNPGGRTFQRLNRAEYERSIKDLLGLDVNAGDWLPLDTKSANFDNIADVQTPSATLLDSYLDAASEISRLAVGDPRSKPKSVTYKLPRLASQTERVEGAPMGTRGGVSVMHTFPADGEYVFAVSLHAIPTGQLYGSSAPFDEKVEISVNGARVALIDIDRGMSQADPTGMELKSNPVSVRAGLAAHHGGLRPHVRRSGERHHRPGRTQHRGYTNRIAGRNHDHPAPPGFRRPRSVQSNGRVRDVEPPSDLHLSADVARRSQTVCK